VLEGERISERQAVFFLVSTVLATAVLFVPSIVTAAAGRDGWLSVLPAVLCGGGVGWLAARLARRFPGETVIQFAPRLLGTVAGKLVGFCFVFYFFWATYVILAEFHALLGAAYLARTPPVVHIGLLLLLAVCLVRSGLKVYARVNDLVLPVLAGAVLIVIISVVKDIRPDVFLPVLENGLRPVILGAVTPAGWLAETGAAVLMIAPYIAGGRRYADRIVLTATAALAALLFLVLAVAVGNFGNERAASLLFPTFNLVRSVQFDTLPIFNRQDPVFMVTWIAGMLVKVGAFFYLGLLALAQWLGLAGYRPLVLPAAVLIAALTMQGFPDVAVLSRYSAETVPLFLLLINGGLTGALLVAAVLRGSQMSPRPPA